MRVCVCGLSFTQGRHHFSKEDQETLNRYDPGVYIGPGRVFTPEFRDLHLYNPERTPAPAEAEKAA